jgi:NADPH-dependent curcumin reductase CurA
MAEINRAWVFVQRPAGDDFDSVLKFRELPMPEPAQGEVLIRTLYLSLDPANRRWMAGPTYMPPVPVDGPMWGYMTGKVVQSNAAGFASGDLVSGLGWWADYCTAPASALAPVPDTGGLSLADSIGLLRGAGGTAYVGVLDVGQLKPGETFVVSGAAGSVGSLAGQIAKIAGAGKVIGIAGSAEKCAWLTDELGFDHAIDYRRQNVQTRLAELCPNGVDLYFENVGGAIANAVAANMAKGGRIAVCGMVAQYNEDAASIGLDLMPIVLNGCTVRGYTLFEFLDRLPAISAKLAEWRASGRLKQHTDIVEGLENALAGFKQLFTPGSPHKGKMLVRVDQDAR